MALAYDGRPSDPSVSGGRSSPAYDSDPATNELMAKYYGYGDTPPRFDIDQNDGAHPRAHTRDRHGADIPLERDPGTKTIEGRIYGDTGWHDASNWSYRWTDDSTMTRTINDYVARNWDAIRSDLAQDDRHSAYFNAGHKVGEGYFNTGMYSSAPDQSRFSTTSHVRITILPDRGTDPPTPYILTAFPAPNPPEK